MLTTTKKLTHLATLTISQGWVPVQKKGHSYISKQKKHCLCVFVCV